MTTSPTNQEPDKLFNDSVHGSINLHPLCVAIIDTPQFQRLRYIRQLGVTHLVYPSAAHSRFEHSLGVCHLAGIVVDRLRRQHPELEISDAEALCVRIAGLCHDLGHGPWSHLFEKFVITLFGNKEYTHEHISVLMFEHLLESDNLRDKFGKYGINDESDFQFIKECMVGRKMNGGTYVGRPDIKKRFLYEIVCNESSGIDVDKWDYFTRDSLHLGIPNSFDYMRAVLSMKVHHNPMDANDPSRIVFRDKELHNIYNMFQTRCDLHRRAYQHNVVKAIELMMIDMLVEAADAIKLLGEDESEISLKQAIECEDMVAFGNLTESVVHLISSWSATHPARKLWDAIQRRKLYPQIGDALVGTEIDIDPNKLSEDLRMILKDISAKSDQKFDLDSNRSKPFFIVSPADINFGKNSANPVENVRFYKKTGDGAWCVLTGGLSNAMLPRIFQEKYIRVYARFLDKDYCLIKRARKSFNRWCEENSYLIGGPLGHLCKCIESENPT